MNSTLMMVLEKWEDDDDDDDEDVDDDDVQYDVKMIRLVWTSTVDYDICISMVYLSLQS